MLQGLFNYDNPVWRFIGKLGDLIILNVLWIVCSIPIFTIGASTTAVYYVTLKMVRDEEDSTIKSFFRSFKSNFKQATAIWLILLAAGAVLAFANGSTGDGIIMDQRISRFSAGFQCFPEGLIVYHKGPFCYCYSSLFYFCMFDIVAVFLPINNKRKRM